MSTPTHLLQLACHWERLGPVKHSDVVKAQKASTEQIFAIRILSVHPPENKFLIAISSDVVVMNMAL